MRRPPGATRSGETWRATSRSGALVAPLAGGRDGGGADGTGGRSTRPSCFSPRSRSGSPRSSRRPPRATTRTSRGRWPDHPRLGGLAVESLLRGAACVFALVIVLDVLWSRRWSLARDLLVAGLLVVGAAVVLSRIVELDWVPIESHLLSRWGYPELRLAAATAILVGRRPGARPLGPACSPSGSIPIATLGAVCDRRRATVSRPSRRSRSASAPARSCDSRSARPQVCRRRPTCAGRIGGARGRGPRSCRRRGNSGSAPASYAGHDADGRSLKVRVLGRDAQDTNESPGGGASWPTAIRPAVPRSAGWSRSSTRPSGVHGRAAGVRCPRS